MIAGTSLGLAFTSAVAATVVSEGRIEIPVVMEVAAAIPVIGPRVKENAPEPAQLARRQAESGPAKPAVETKPAEDAAPADLQRQWAQRQAAAMRQRIEERRAAGLPTPRADRIQAQARQIVERRQGAGKPTPPVEQVERALVRREIRAMRQHARQQAVAASISDEQLRRFADRLPPVARERFETLDPAMQRQAVARWLERIRTRRALRNALQQPAAPQAPTQEPQDELVAGSEGFAQQPR